MFEKPRVEIWNSKPGALSLEHPDGTKEMAWSPYAIVYGQVSGVAAPEVSLRLPGVDSGALVASQTRAEMGEGGEYGARFDLSAPLSAVPDRASVTISQGEESEQFEVALPMARLHGTVTDYSGQPIPGAYIDMGKRRGDSYNSDCATAVTDASGRYEIDIPCGLYRRNEAILSSWGTETLECYVMELPLQEDTRLDLRIGQAEVAKLAATHVEDDGGSFSVRFICWTINESIVPLLRAREDGRDAAIVDPEYYPRLLPEEVEVYVNDRPAQVHSFTPCPIQCMGGQPVPGYHLECSWPERTRGRHVLKVVVHHVARLEHGREVVEEGEATFWDLRFPGADI